MSDLPIIFSAAMIRALLDGRKTMTRRLAWKESFNIVDGLSRKPSPWQRVKTGDHLWVRETFVLEDNYEYREATLPKDRPIKTVDHGPDFGESDLIPHYRATEPEPHIVGDREDETDDRTRWSSPIHMPRWASRLTLLVTATKIEKLQEISEADAKAEGMFRFSPMPEFKDQSLGWSYQNGAPATHLCDTARDAFGLLWCLLHGEQAWDANPEVIALTFSIEKTNIDTLPKAEAA